MEYVDIVLEWPSSLDIVKQIYNDEYQDLLRPWYSALRNIYGEETNNYDGYVHKVIPSGNKIRLVCYLLDDDNKVKHLQYASLDWKIERNHYIEAALRRHVKGLNIVIDPKIDILMCD